MPFYSCIACFQVKLESWQEEDIKSRSEKLQKELDMLTTFQVRF